MPLMCPAITASSPPSIWPWALVGVTQASTCCSSIEPRTTSAPGSPLNTFRHSRTTSSLMSTSTTRNASIDMAILRGSLLDLDQVLQPLLVRLVNDELVVVELRIHIVGAAHAVATIVAGRRLRQAVGDLVVLLHL